MSPRRKNVPDHDILVAAARVASERGARRTRLSDVAQATGLAPATLVQRFGSRRGLLAAVGKIHVAAIGTAFGGGPSAHLDRLSEALSKLLSEGHLLFLAQNAPIALDYSVELRKQIGLALRAAVGAGELAPCEISLQARRAQLGYYGLAMAALLEDEQPDTDRIRALLRDVLADFL